MNVMELDPNVITSFAPSGSSRESDGCGCKWGRSSGGKDQEGAPPPQAVEQLFKITLAGTDAKVKDDEELIQKAGKTSVQTRHH